MKDQRTQTAKTAATGGNGEHSATVCPVVVQQPAPRETVCEVCGHVNKGQTLICEMCSNYLFK